MRPKSRVSLGEACMILAAAICTAVMGGWFFGVEWLTDPPPDRVQMQFNTTVCGLALALSQLRVLRRQPWIRVFLVLALVLTLLNLLQYALDRDLGIDELFMTPPRDGRYIHPGRMAVNTSVMFLLASSIGLLDSVLRRPGVRRSLASLSTVVVALNKTVSFEGRPRPIGTKTSWNRTACGLPASFANPST